MIMIIRFNALHDSFYHHSGNGTSLALASYKTNQGNIDMLKLSNATEYSIKACLNLVEAYHMDTIRSITSISETEDIPETFFRKLLQPLIKSRIIETKRGYSGGIRLARSPEQISLYEIIESIEGSIDLNECVTDPAICQFVGSCAIHEVWIKTTNILAEHLGEYSLQSLWEQQQSEQFSDNLLSSQVTA